MHPAPLAVMINKSCWLVILWLLHSPHTNTAAIASFNMMLLLCHDACQASVTYLSMQEDFSEVCGPQCWRFEGLQWKVYDMLCSIPAFASNVLLFYCVLTSTCSAAMQASFMLHRPHVPNRWLLSTESGAPPCYQLYLEVQDGDPYGAGSTYTVSSDSKGEHLWNVQEHQTQC